jgi:hypothetical protein
MAKSAAKKAAATRVKAVAPMVQAAIEAAAQAAEDEPTSTYIVLHPVSHDNDYYKRGEHIDLTDERSEDLLALKVITPYVAPAEASEETK